MKAREEAKEKLSKEAKAKLLAAKRSKLLARSKEFAARKKAFYKAASAEGPISF